MACKRGETTGFGWQCLVARRLAERGVRFIELVDTGSRPNWDYHGEMKEHVPLAKAVDQPIAAMIKDLKQRNMLDETLIVWGTEFGRTPTKEGKNGRGHHGETAFRSGWLGAETKVESSMARPTTSAATSCATKWMFTTCTPQCSTNGH